MPTRNFTGTAYNSAADTLIEHVKIIRPKVDAEKTSPNRPSTLFIFCPHKRILCFLHSILFFYAKNNPLVATILYSSIVVCNVSKHMF